MEAIARQVVADSPITWCCASAGELVGSIYGSSIAPLPTNHLKNSPSGEPMI